MGKTLAFWSPLALMDTGVQIVVTPLNQLGHQSVSFLAKAGINSISISAETASLVNFRDIEDMRYCAIITSPEQLVKAGGEFEKLLRKPTFASQIMRFVFDKAHCITSWGEFRTEYKELECLRYILPCYVPFMITSATLTPNTLRDVQRLLHMRSENLLLVHMSTDQPNIKICVRKIRYSLSSYMDLAFLVPTGWTPGDQVPPKFLIFFDSIQDAIGAAKYLQSRLPPEMRERIKWFNSDMTTKFKETEVDNLVTRDTWGLCTTESFGMGMDVPNITLVIQWRATCKLSTVWQRFGRAVRDRALRGTALLFAEKEHFDDVREEKRKHGNIVTDVGDSGPSTTDTLGNASVSDAQLQELMKPNIEVASKQKKERELDPAMDWLINTHLRGIGCRRKVFDLHFDNASALVDHLACDQTITGCSRCAPVTPNVCCDIHHPSAFPLFDTLIPQPPKVPNHSRLPNYSMGPKEYELCEALEDWREEKMAEKYGHSHLIDIGPSIIMSDSILDHLVNCAHHEKIKTIEDLRKETHWPATAKYGPEVLTIIHRIIPVKVVSMASTNTPLQCGPLSIVANPPRGGNVALPSTVSVVKKTNRCSACQQEGHNKHNHICPLHPTHNATRTSTTDKENTLPNNMAQGS
ncbi:P-loop containing nucleoside triphosphate hydrolase protein [Suillus subluteus]|nr:P-loop containing nucleoside triphosphate hydrolase protein [Suillus subluteus]KAG1862661.1 P-loop containing nucleoside triphosphate hydrolase protein [Suillus subluteus]